jgi:hypothetical protein
MKRESYLPNLMTITEITKKMIRSHSIDFAGEIEAYCSLTAVIRRHDTGRGHGTALPKRLVETAPTCGCQNTGVEQTGSDISIRYFGRKFGFANTTDERNLIIPVSQLRGLLAQLTWKRVGLFSYFHLAAGRRWRNAVRAQSRMRLGTSASWDDDRGRCAGPSEQRQQPTVARS